MTIIRFPQPDSDDDFDHLVCQIAERQYGVSASRYGRSGQAQHGVDITLTDSRGRLVAIQSKHVVNLTEKIMNEEIEKLLGLGDKKTAFPQTVFEYIFATSAARDTKHDDHAAALSRDHAPLRVVVWPWEKINEMLNKMPTLATEYCWSILTPIPLEDVKKQNAIALRRALARPALLDGFQFEIDFIEQSQALRDIAGFLRTGNLSDRTGTHVLSVLPYTGDDDYGRELESLAKQLGALCRHIETNSNQLSQYALGPSGRVINVSDLGPTQAYLQLEKKRLKVIATANSILATFDLDPLS